MLVIAGVQADSKYEYLNHTILNSMVNGTAVRFTRDGEFEPYYTSECLRTRPTADVSATTDITNIVLNVADAVSTQWSPIKDILSPLAAIYQAAKSIQSGTATIATTNLLTWTANAGVYTRTETVSQTQMTLTARLLWGDGAPGHTLGEAIVVNIHEASNYFTGLTVTVDGASGDLVFSFSSVGPLAPMLGIPATASSGYRVNAIEWAQDVVKQFKTMNLQIDLTAAYNVGNDKLDVALNYTGKSSYGISYDPLTFKITATQLPIELSLKTGTGTSAGARTNRSQIIDLGEWTLKVFPSQNGAKGSITFDARNDVNFDFVGYVAYNSDAQQNKFLKCKADNSPLPFP
jgi:hypothetical protein